MTAILIKYKYRELQISILLQGCWFSFDSVPYIPMTALSFVTIIVNVSISFFYVNINSIII